MSSLYVVRKVRDISYLLIAFLFACLPACLLACLLACLFACLSTSCLLACLLTCCLLLVYLLACLPPLRRPGPNCRNSILGAWVKGLQSLEHLKMEQHPDNHPGDLLYWFVDHDIHWASLVTVEFMCIETCLIWLLRFISTHLSHLRKIVILEPAMPTDEWVLLRIEAIEVCKQWSESNSTCLRRRGRKHSFQAMLTIMLLHGF